MVELKDDPWWRSSPELLTELKDALSHHAPCLWLDEGEERLVARGIYELIDDNERLDSYAIEIVYKGVDPTAEPQVWEIGGAIERIKDNHINDRDGACCTGVYDEWRALTGDTSFAGFLQGPLRNFFLSQSIYRRTGRWVFGERAHGVDGMIEAYGALVEDPTHDAERVGRTLSFLALGRAKGHWRCPCGTNLPVRSCCLDRLKRVANRIAPDLAARLFDQLMQQAKLAKRVEWRLAYLK